jgi:HSP20 family protein
MTMRPYRGFYDMQSEMNRMFDEVFGGLSRRGGRQHGDDPTRWAPVLDVLQEDGDIVVRAELPGVKQEDVDIWLLRAGAALWFVQEEHDVAAGCR